MRTVLVILGIWLLINVLFVVVMIPPRKPRKSGQPRSSSGLAPVPIGQNAYAYDEDEKVSVRHTIIAIALGALFSLTPPLLEAVDDIKRMIGKYRKSRQQAEAEGDGHSLETVLKDPRANQTSADGSSSGEQDASKH
ncbi:phosphonate metabolism protein PhnM [Bradyrhizobium sp. AZCC 2230]|uniref:phosphonate metabolism protein PhnM n=1 Tax=Bradyrhizobium sp. AZCC 2230 TaxID=3117021 RepID=UPI002FF1777C